VIDDNELVRVTLIEVENEFNFSNPTNYFNLTLPHIAIKQNAFQSMTYSQYKQAMRETDQKEVADNEQSATSSEDATAASSTAEEEPPQDFWYSSRQQGPMLLRVQVANKRDTRVIVQVKISSSNGNLMAPISPIKEKIPEQQSKTILILQKANPWLPWGEIDVEIVEAYEKRLEVKNEEIGGAASRKIGYTVNMLI